MEDRVESVKQKQERWEDPNRVEAGQAWDYIGEDEVMLVIVTETRDQPPSRLDKTGRRNASVYVVEHRFEGFDYEARTIAFSEKHMRRNFKRVS
jgi:hypothetical protein